MKRFSAILPVILVLSLLLGISGLGSGALADPPSRSNSQENYQRYIVRFKPGVTPTRMDQLNRRAGGIFESSIPGIGAQVVKIPRSSNSTRLSTYRSFGEVAFIEPDYIANAVETPDDSRFGSQWGMIAIKAPEAWNVSHGSSSVRIAILDTGIDAEHVDLASKVIIVKNFSSSYTTDDLQGHGTHVAGIASAETNNAIGVAGVAYDASLMNVKVLGDNGSGYYSAIAQGIIWATDNGADVINMSLGGGSSSSTLQQAVDYAWSNGVVVVAAAGNNGRTSPSYPAYYNNVISVAATNSSDRLYSFSNYGSWVDVAAPGSALSTYPDNRYATMSGTSMASPFVAGLAGLVCSVTVDSNGDGKTNDEVRTSIENNTDSIGTSIAKGRINAYKAIASVSAPPATGTVTGTVLNSDTGQPIPGATVTDGTRSDITAASGGYALSDVPPGDYTLTASAGAYQTGTSHITIAAGETLTADFALNPNPVNHPPVLDPIGNKTVSAGTSLTFAVTAADPDGDTLTFIAAGLPAGSSFAAGTFSWTPTAAGPYSIQFEVADGQGGTDFEDITVTVVAAPADTMWVDSIAITPGGSYLYFDVKVVDPQPVAGARVTLKVQTGSYSVGTTKTTGPDGKVTFRLYPAVVGTTYAATVTGLVGDGYTWDSASGITSASYTLTAATPPPPTTTTAPPPSTTDEQIQTEAFNLINNARTSAGLEPLVNDPNLAALAREHVLYMIQQNQLSHDGFYDRASRSGYRSVGENVAMGYRNAQSLADGWLSSSGHKANIMNPAFRYSGLAYINGWACQIFGG
jgi:thermitase